MTANKILYVFTKPPHSNASAQEGLDAVLVGTAMELEVSLLFLHDGLYQLLRQQTTDGTALKHYGKAFAALQDLGVEAVYVHDSSMHARGLSLEQLSIEAEQVNSGQVRDLLREQSRVFTF